MEEDPSPKGYEIKDSRIPIILALRPISTLKPHEETIPLEMERIVESLRHDPVLRHPLIADRESGLVLDGTHRLAALKGLGCFSVPCALIDYQESTVKVERWFRIIADSSLHEFNAKLAGTTSHEEKPVRAEQCLLRRDCYASLEDIRSCLVFPSEDRAPIELVRKAFAIEKVARDEGLGIKYSDNKKLPSSENRLMLSTVKLEKKEIVDSCLRGVLFPPKTTRHIIPSRPLGTSTPLEWLRAQPSEENELRFTKNLRSRRVKRLPEGSKVGSRRYQEEVFVFD